MSLIHQLVMQEVVTPSGSKLEIPMVRHPGQIASLALHDSGQIRRTVHISYDFFKVLEVRDMKSSLSRTLIQTLVLEPGPQF